MRCKPMHVLALPIDLARYNGGGSARVEISIYADGLDRLIRRALTNKGQRMRIAKGALILRVVEHR